MSTNGPLLASDDEGAEFPAKIDFLVDAVKNLTTEVHSNTAAVGRMAAEQAKSSERIYALEVSSRSFRAKLKSIPADMQGIAHDASEDTARHEVAKLRTELEKKEQSIRIAELEAEKQRLLKSQEDVARFAKARRKRAWSLVKWALGILGPPVGLFLERYLHVLPK